MIHSKQNLDWFEAVVVVVVVVVVVALSNRDLAKEK